MNEACPPLIDGNAADALIEPLTELVIRAGEAILAVNRSAMKVEGKSDGSPVTEADLAADRVISAGLARLAPNVPSLSEERTRLARPPYRGSFFLVDPLDGTKEFISRNGEFTVNIALIEGGRPVLGVVYAPAIGAIYAGGEGRGAKAACVENGTIGAWRPISVRACTGKGISVLASRSHLTDETKAFIEKHSVADFVSAGSSLKFCKLAAGEADLYPRLGRTMEWDTAAGDALLRAADGAVLAMDGKPLQYGTSAGFMDHFGLESLEDLPGLDELKSTGLLEPVPPAPPTGPEETPEEE
jgi:3'(2'),5'-bisphosphate nucleotidase